MADLRTRLYAEVVKQTQNPNLFIKVPQGSFVIVVTAGKDYQGFRLQNLVAHDDNLPDEVAYNLFTLVKGATVAIEKKQQTLRRIGLEALRDEQGQEKLVTRNSNIESLYPRGNA